MKQEKGFTLVEILVAGTMAGVFLTFCVQFFLTQLHQYQIISWSNQLNEQLRTFAKFVEKDVHNSLEFFAFSDLDALLKEVPNSAISYGGAEDIGGDCVLLVEEKGRVEGGRGVAYFVGSKQSFGEYSYYPVYRAIVTFSAEGKVNETAENLQQLIVAHLKPELDGWAGSFMFSDQAVQLTSEHLRIFKVLDRKKVNGEYVAGCRHGLSVSTRLVQPGLPSTETKKKISYLETPCEFTFFSRNPRF